MIGKGQDTGGYRPPGARSVLHVRPADRKHDAAAAPGQEAATFAALELTPPSAARAAADPVAAARTLAWGASTAGLLPELSPDDIEADPLAALPAPVYPDPEEDPAVAAHVQSSMESLRTRLAWMTRVVGLASAGGALAGARWLAQTVAAAHDDAAADRACIAFYGLSSLTCAVDAGLALADSVAPRQPGPPSGSGLLARALHAAFARLGEPQPSAARHASRIEAAALPMLVGTLSLGYLLSQDGSIFDTDGWPGGDAHETLGWRVVEHGAAAALVGAARALMDRMKPTLELPPEAVPAARFPRESEPVSLLAVPVSQPASGQGSEQLPDQTSGEAFSAAFRKSPSGSADVGGEHRVQFWQGDRTVPALRASAPTDLLDMASRTTPAAPLRPEPQRAAEPTLPSLRDRRFSLETPPAASTPSPEPFRVATRFTLPEPDPDVDLDEIQPRL